MIEKGEKHGKGGAEIAGQNTNTRCQGCSFDFDSATGRGAGRSSQKGSKKLHSEETKRDRMPCARCGGAADSSFKCQCKQVQYCSMDCQAADWPSHKQKCRDQLDKKVSKAKTEHEGYSSGEGSDGSW